MSAKPAGKQEKESDYIGVLAKAGAILAITVICVMFVRWYVTKFINKHGDSGPEPQALSAWDSNPRQLARLPYARPEPTQPQHVHVKEGEWSKWEYAVGRKIDVYAHIGKSGHIDWELKDIQGKVWLEKKGRVWPEVIYVRMKSTKGDFHYTVEKI